MLDADQTAAMTAPPPSERTGRERSPLFRIVRNAASMLVGDAAGQVLTASAIAIAAVKLHPEGFGRLSEAQAFVEPFDAVAGFGLQQVAITVAAQRGKPDGALRGTVLGLQAIFACCAIGCVVGAASLTGRSALLPIIAVLCVNMLLIPITTASVLSFQFHQTMHRLLAVPFLGSVVRFGGTLAAARKLNVPVGHQIAALAGTITTAALQFFSMKRWYPEPLVFDRALAKKLVVLAWPAAVLEVVVVAYSRGSYFFLHGAGAHVQGEYGAADRLVRPLLSIAGAVAGSALPTVATLAAKHDYAALRRTYVTAMRRIFQVLLPVLVAAWVLSTWLLRKAAPEYAEAVLPFRVLSVGAVFMFLNYLSTTYVIALGRFRLIMWVALFNLVVYLTLASQLIPRFAATGAAFSTSIMEGINTICQIVIVLYLLRTGDRAKHVA